MSGERLESERCRVVVVRIGRIGRLKPVKPLRVEQLGCKDTSQNRKP